MGRKHTFNFELRMAPFVGYLNIMLFFCHNKSMPQLLIKLLLISFLFGSVDAAVDCASIDIGIDHGQGVDHLIDDHDKPNSTDDEQDCFHHCHCNCAGQLGLAFTTCVSSIQTSEIVKISDTHLYRSSLSPPLFRPPII